MAAIVLRDIVTEADRASVTALRVGPGQDVFVASVRQCDVIDHEAILRLDLRDPGR